MNKIIDAIAELLEEHLLNTRGIKTIYRGDPIWIPQADLPCIIIDGASTAIQTSSNLEDEPQWNISVSVVTDDRKYLGANKNTENSNIWLKNTMEEKQTDNLKLKDDTILAVIRNKFDQDSTVTIDSSNVNIQYPISQIGLRSSKFNANQYPTLEAVLTFTSRGISYVRNT